VLFGTNPGKVLMLRAERENRVFHTRENRFQQVRIHQMTRALDASDAGLEKQGRAAWRMGGSRNQGRETTAAT